VRRLTFLLAAAVLFAQDAKVPRPEDYPVDAVYSGTPTALARR